MALLALGSIPNYGQLNVWTSLGPNGGQVGILTDPQAPGTLYATSGQTTTFKTTDAAAHWRPWDTASIRLLAVDPQNSGTLYGSSVGGLQRSADGGSTWSFAGSGLPVSRYQLPCVPAQLVFDPRNSSTLYGYFDGSYGANCTGLFKSTDGAATWTAASAGLPSGLFTYGINSLLVDPKNPAMLYVSGTPIFVGGGVFQSSDGGANWSAIAGRPANNGGYVRLLAIDGQDSRTLYAFTYLDGGNGPAVPALYRSPDAGSSWSVMATGWLFFNLVADSHDAGTLYARVTTSLGAGIVKSTDAGANWRFILENAYAMALAPTQTGPDILYATGGVDGVLKSADGGMTWTAANDGLAATYITAVAVHPQDSGRLYALGTSFVYASQDGGKNWGATQRCGDDPGVPGFAFDPGDPNSVYLNSGGLCATRDGGASWKQLLPPQRATYLTVPGPLTDSQGVIYYGNLKSTDHGANWQEIGMRPGVLGIDPLNPGTLYGAPDFWNNNALAIHSQLSKSLDGGLTWTPLARDWHGYLLTAVAVDPTKSDTVYAETGAIQDDFATVPDDYYNPDSELARNNCCLFRSDDGGANWVRLDVPGYRVYQGGFLGIDPRGAIYVRTAKGLVRSLDHGNTWSPVPTAGLKADISFIGFDSLDPNHLFAGTYGGGVFEITLVP
jgi:photosystem II stability/assembly factor-like uncharacterized protein